MTLTPEQFNKIALKVDLDRLEEKVDNLHDDMSKILTAVDGLAKKVDTISGEFVANQAAHDRYEVRLNRLERPATA